MVVCYNRVAGEGGSTPGYFARAWFGCSFRPPRRPSRHRQRGWRVGRGSAMSSGAGPGLSRHRAKGEIRWAHL